MKLSQKLFGKDIAGLAWSFHVNPDSCANPSYYDNYIRLSAISDYRKGMGVTFVLGDAEKNRIAGFVTLRATSLVSEGENSAKYVEPSLEIAELAVDADYEHCGVGSILVSIAIDAADNLRRTQLGIRHVVVCADSAAVGFYKKLGFGDLSSLYEALHDGWNDDCAAMYITMPENDM